MKLIFNSLLIIVAASLGLAVGFAFRGKPKLSPSSPATPPLSETSKAAAWKVNTQTNVASLDESPLTTKLERDLSMSSGVTRWLYWLDALEKAMPQDFPQLARLAQGNPTALQFVAARWAEVAPLHMFETIVAASKNGAGLPVNELASVLFREWTKRDPDAVIAALSGAQEFDNQWRGNWRRTVASYVFENDVERGLLLMARWRIENFGPDMKAVSKWAAADPLHAAEFTFRNPVGYAARMMIETVGKEWAKTDPAGALTFAMTKQGDLGSALAQSVVKEWAGRKLQDAADWLAAADARTRNRLSSPFVEMWARQDAAGALEWCAMNLSGSTLAEAAGSVLKGAAEKDLAGARAVVVAMNPSPARAEAAAAVAEKSLPHSVMAKGVPPETTAWMAGLDPQSLKRALDEVYWDWMQADSKSLAEFLKSCSTAQLPSRFYDNLAPRLARKNPLDALQWAAELRPEHALSAGSEAFAEWRRAQPEAAMKWLEALPSSDSRRAKLLSMVKTR
jgi:hypothetical protein